ncbi:MAG: hypothetical protein V3T83_16450 [Acidobacteriota bacterium]
MPRKRSRRKAKAAASRLTPHRRFALALTGFKPPSKPSPRPLRWNTMEECKATWFGNREKFFRRRDPSDPIRNPASRPWGYLEFELKLKAREGESVHDTLVRLGLFTFAERKAIPGFLRRTPWEGPATPGVSSSPGGMGDFLVRRHLKNFLRPGEDPKECVERLLKG